MTSKYYEVSQIWVYPIKSLGGIRLSTTKVFPKGFEHDRRFMLVNSAGVALTQRTHPVLALFQVNIDGPELVVQYKTHSIRIPATPEACMPPSMVTIWDDSVRANEVGPEFSFWFSRLIGEDCRFMYFPESSPRPVDPQYQVDNEHVSLADAYPVLIIGQESLNELNSRLSSPVPVNRFRPNIVFTGGNPFDEDQWGEFAISSAEFIAVKPCARCVLTTVDQHTGEKGPEPLRTLAKFRTHNNKVLFGQNVLVKNPSEIRTGEQLIVKTYR